MVRSSPVRGQGKGIWGQRKAWTKAGTGRGLTLEGATAGESWGARGWSGVGVQGVPLDMRWGGATLGRLWGWVVGTGEPWKDLDQ